MWEVSFGDEKGSHLLGWCPLHIRPHITCGAGTRARAQGNGSLVSGQGLGPRASLRLGSSRSEEVLDVREPVLKAGSSVSSRGGPQGLLAFLSVPLLVADVSDISRLLSAFHKPHAGLIQAAQQLLSDEQAPLRQKLLADLLHTVSENIAAETRAEDPPWFEGLESRFRSKSGYLRYSCESRIRSYLREVNSYASVVGVEAQEEYSRIVDVMCRELRAAQYNGSYFDRGAEAGGRLCTSEGWFCCQGPFDMDTCASKHSINPYGNRESRVLFSTWNLDHIIEKKRTVVPALAEAVTERDGREVAWEYFYSLLFTSENLKLVHIACHKKTTHKLSCDPRRIYKPQTKPKRRRPARKCQ
ncbi:DNA fragmentation factor subunit beta isoform X4 [Mirounga angustirostris]|uniref:DNA fragmentation factor subunit beta isoform X4 n=1 Tax=Mirounga angustirostris TaxID=9716 RepID=UPI00313EF9A0